MAVVHDNSPTPVGAQAASITVPSVDATATDPFIKLAIATRGTSTVTATFNGSENFTIERTLQVGNARVTILSLLPSSTTADIVASFSGSGRSIVAPSVYRGVNQITPVRAGTVQSASGTSTAPTVSVTGNSGDLIVDALAQVVEGPATMTADHTERANATQTGGGLDTGCGAQELAATGGADAMGWTLGGSADWCIAAMSLVPSAAADESITADSGSYSISGTTTPIKADFNTISEIGSYLISGTTTPLKASLNIISESGSYAITGTSIDLRFGSILTVDPGSYTYTGTFVNLNFAGNMTVDAGSYIITGTDLPLLDAANIWTDQPIIPAVWVDGIEQITTWTDKSLTTTIWTDI